MKILLECTSMGGLQRNADVLIGRAIELLAQPEKKLQPLSNERLEDLTNYYSGYPTILGRAIEMAHDIGVDDE